MLSPAKLTQRLPVAIVSSDHRAVDQLLRALQRCADIVVVGVYADSWQASRGGGPLQPRVYIIDIEKGTDQQGLDIGLQLRRRSPNAGIVLLTAQGDPRFLTSLPPAATHGWAYLVKSLAGDSLTMERAVQSVASGLVVVDPSIVARMRPKRDGLLAALTEREQEILSLVAQGLSNAGIAQRLVLAEKSVENRLVEIYRKLELDGGHADHNPRVQAVLLYLQHSVLHHDSPAEPRP
ncbi:MAG: putative two-component system response regulator, LuxR family protein [Dehalococcoidia bacterium]|nr:MAG: putative two-component system response regulator, LuxR family protein [Dehalococcoidia bacterium]